MKTLGAAFMRFILGIISAIGSIIVLIGFLKLVQDNSGLLFGIGLLMMVISEAVSIFITKYQEKDYLLRLKSDFLTIAGATMALPILLFVFYLTSNDRNTLAFSLVFGILGLLRVASLIIKVYLIDKILSGS